jgi:hypothetical protein
MNLRKTDGEISTSFTNLLFQPFDLAYLRFQVNEVEVVYS